MARHRISGSVVVYGTRGLPEVEKAYGVAAGSNPPPLGHDHIFRLASLSKPVTAAAVLALIDSGNLKLETRLSDLFPMVAKAADPRLPKITVRNLLQHRGGWDFQQTFDPFFLDRTTAEEWLGPIPALQDCRPVAIAMLKHELQFSPGERYAYSNLGYCWLGLIIEQVTGEPYERAVHDLVRTRQAGLSLSPGNMSIDEILDLNKTFPLLVPQIVGPAGGWQGRARDFFAFASDSIDSRVLKTPTGEEHADYYGLGWRVFPEDGPLLTHYGAMPGVFTLVLRDMRGRVLVALFNGRPADDWPAFLQLKQAFVDATDLGN